MSFRSHATKASPAFTRASHPKCSDWRPEVVCCCSSSRSSWSSSAAFLDHRTSELRRRSSYDHTLARQFNPLLFSKQCPYATVAKRRAASCTLQSTILYCTMGPRIHAPIRFTYRLAHPFAPGLVGRTGLPAHKYVRNNCQGKTAIVFVQRPARRSTDMPDSWPCHDDPGSVS